MLADKANCFPPFHSVSGCLVVNDLPIPLAPPSGRRLVFALCMGAISISLFSALRRFIPFYVLRQAGCSYACLSIAIPLFCPDAAVPVFRFADRLNADCHAASQKA